MTNTINDILQTFPSSSTNSSREIVGRLLRKMQDSPNDRTAQKLDNLGIVTDHDDYRDRFGEWEQSDFSN